MSKLNLINYVLNTNFIWNKNSFEEPSASMTVDLKKDGCRSLIFEFDKVLDRKYKGGLFPFFNNSNSNVCKKCDYIVFAERGTHLFALIVELKTSAQGTMPQLNAGECFVDYVINTVNRINKTNHTIIKRKISIREFERKRKTKIKEVEYDQYNHHFFEQDKFRIVSFLK